MLDRRKEDAKAFESYVQRVIREKEAPGIAVTVVSRDQTLYQNFFGVRDTATQAPLDGDTIFGLASVTKSFTCVAVMQLHERGLLDVDDLVSKSLDQNFVPVVDDRDIFIGIITRKNIIKYYYDKATNQKGQKERKPQAS